ncbi:MAG: TetR/AcrR family transcriptional regulator [Coriobacteriia bacterium]|nr:TetR/AcrR family transcriptional regulator [Coriobacteriia bacterium]
MQGVDTKRAGFDTSRPQNALAGNVMRNEQARNRLVNALFTLMGRMRFSEITVSDLVREAGVARITYYRNFEAKEDIVEAYMEGLHRAIVQEDASPGTAASAKKLLDEGALAAGFARSLALMRDESERILTLVHGGFTTTLQHMMDGYLEERLGDMPASSIERFELYFVSGAMLNVLVQWLEQGAEEEPADLALFVAQLLHRGLPQA